MHKKRVKVIYDFMKKSEAKTSSLTTLTSKVAIKAKDPWSLHWDTFSRAKAKVLSTLIEDPRFMLLKSDSGEEVRFSLRENNKFKEYKKSREFKIITEFYDLDEEIEEDND